MINGLTKNHAIGTIIGLSTGISAGAILGTAMIVEAVTAPIAWPAVGIMIGVVGRRDEGIKAQAKQAVETATILGIAQTVISPIVILAAPLVATGVAVAGGVGGFCMAETKEVTKYYNL